jgi:hypothetical protein
MAEAGYPRDIYGYGRNPPDPRWPGDARIAVQFVVNVEEGGKNNIRHGDRASEAFLSDILGVQPWPGQRHANIESMYDMVRAQASGGYGGFSPSALCQGAGVQKIWLHIKEAGAA